MILLIPLEALCKEQLKIKENGSLNMKKRLWLRIVLGLAAVVLAALAVLVTYLTVTEYRPQARQTAEIVQLRSGSTASVGEQMTVYSWNIGYAGLDAASDFFMDGGSKVNSTTEEVEKNLSAIKSFISSQPAAAWLLQEVDVDSARTGYINEAEAISAAYGGSFALAYNYKCSFVPIPLPPIGRVESGIATFTCGSVTGAPERIALPCSFSWPVSAANLKRCLLVTRLAVEGSSKEVVLVNLHLEAYDDGEGKIAQTKLLMEILQQEYEKGNYVIAGGDFNQTFPGVLDTYPVQGDVWTPSVMEEGALPDGFRYVFDDSNASCRLLDRPLNENSQLYVLDGFVVSANVQVDMVETVVLDFANSDHNPVKLNITLLP